MSLPPQTLAAVATVVAALIAGLIAFVTLRSTRNRRHLNSDKSGSDGLREDLATFLSAARACARAFAAKTALGENYATVAFPLSDEQVAKLRLSAAQTFYRIKLRPKSRRTGTCRITAIVNQSNRRAEQTATRQSTTDVEILAAIERASDYASPCSQDRMEASQEW